MEPSDSKREVQLKFVRSEAEAEAISDTDLVIVWPASDYSGDESLRSQINFMVKVDGNIYRPMRPAAMIFSKFSGSHEAIHYLGNDLRRGGGEGQFAFASLQMEVNEYRRIRRAFSRTTAISVLEAMHDIVVEERKAKPREWLDEVKRLEAFSIELLGPTSRFFAYRRGYDFLIGNEANAIHKAAASAELVFDLSGFNGPHVIPLSFGKTNAVSRRINVLIGRNGVGKSQALAHLVMALAFPRSEKARIEPQGEFNRVIAFSGVPGQTSLPRRSPAPGALQYHFYNLSPGHRLRKRHPITAALIDIIRSEDYLKEMRRLDVLAEAIQSWVMLDQIYLPILGAEIDAKVNWQRPIIQGGIRYASVDEVRQLSKFQQLIALSVIDQSKAPKFRFGESLTPLSSGQELYFRFALHLCESIDVGTLVLIDEPENHLHPNFVTGLMALLRDILAQTGSFALIASHSPFVVREVTHNDVVILEHGEDREPRVRRPRLRTLGASVAAVSLYVFGDETISTLTRLTLESQELPRGPVDEAVFDMLSEEYSNEAVSHIRSVLLDRVTANNTGSVS